MPAMVVQTTESDAAVLGSRRAGLYAHRGLPFFAPENTTLSVQLARQRGFENVEIDITATAGAGYVAFHDPALKRMFGEIRWLCAMLVEDIQRLSLGDFFMRSAFGLSEEQIRRVKSANDPWVAEIYAQRISTIEEMFTAFGDSIGYHLDMKTPSCSADQHRGLDRLVSLIEERGLTDRVIIESRNLNVLRRLRSTSHTVRLMYWNDGIFEHPESRLNELGELGIRNIDFHHRQLRRERLDRLDGFVLHTFTPNTVPEVVELLGHVAHVLTDLDLFGEPPLDQYQFFNQQAERVRIERHGDEVSVQIVEP